jgi:dienelactone hydrolase
MRECVRNAALLFAISHVHAQVPPTGQIVDKVVCEARPDQSYALYLPSRYTPERKWPILYAFDPVARGRVPVERFQDAAEKYGYIVVGSHNSRNGPWQVSRDAMQAMWDDTQRRWPIDPKRIYATGFSGGARVATMFALTVPDFAGVIACGGGFPESKTPKKLPFSFFGIAGTEDFNYPEMKQVQRDLDAQKAPNRFEIFDGPHRWCPSPLCTEAIEWMELMAMKTGRRTVDPDLVNALLDRTLSRLHHFESGGDLPALYRAYAAAAVDFQGLKDVADFAQRAARLKNSKEVRDAEKRDRQVDERQERLRVELTQSDAGQQKRIVEDLRKKAAAEEDSVDRRVARRVLAGYNISLRERNGATEKQSPPR